MLAALGESARDVTRRTLTAGEVAALDASLHAAPQVPPQTQFALARRMIEVVLAEPIMLSPEERYLHGHYLAYLLSGSRRRGRRSWPAWSSPARTSRSRGRPCPARGRICVGAPPVEPSEVRRRAVETDCNSVLELKDLIGNSNA